MFLVILNTILDSISDIIYKKALAISDIKPTVFQFFWEIFSIPVVLIIMALGFNFKLFADPVILGGFFALSIIFILRNNLAQYLYKNEKISTLLPYSKINNFIIVIIGFLFFHDSSLLSFLICLGAIVLSTIASVDFKNHQFPRNFGKILFHEVIETAELMWSIYLLKMMSSIEYAVIYQLIYVAFAFLIISFSWGLSEFRKFTPRIIKYRVGGYLIGLGSWFIDLFLLKEFWVVMATLFGFFGSSLSIVLAYFLLKEVPEKKEIILWVVMIILAGVGYYFR